MQENSFSLFLHSCKMQNEANQMEATGKQSKKGLPIQNEDFVR